MRCDATNSNRRIIALVRFALPFRTCRSVLVGAVGKEANIRARAQPVRQLLRQLDDVALAVLGCVFLNEIDRVQYMGV